MKKFRERNLYVVAALAAAVLALLGYLALNFAHLPLISHQKTYSADFASAIGLSPGDVVTIAGVRVGAVTGFSLDGSSAKVTFTVNGGPRLGQDTTVDAKVLNPVGVEYLSLNPEGPGTLHGTIPVSRTTTPLNLVEDLNGASNDIQGTNLPQLVKSLDVITQTLDATTPAQTRAAINGVANLSEVLANRQTELDDLIVQSGRLASLLSDHSSQLVNLLSNSNLVLVVLEQRKADIDRLLATTSGLVAQIDHIIGGDQAVLDPMLSNLQAVSAFLAKDSRNIGQAIPLLAAFSRYSANIAGSGPFVDAVAPTLVIPDNLIKQCIAAAKADPLLGCGG
jgi:phospholipid/cholesterol/gamma-HCH transport system substrate-binding protein